MAFGQQNTPQTNAGQGEQITQNSIVMASYKPNYSRAPLEALMDGSFTLDIVYYVKVNADGSKELAPFYFKSLRNLNGESSSQCALVMVDGVLSMIYGRGSNAPFAQLINEQLSGNVPCAPIGNQDALAEAFTSDDVRDNAQTLVNEDGLYLGRIGNITSKKGNMSAIGQEYIHTVSQKADEGSDLRNELVALATQ